MNIKTKILVLFAVWCGLSVPINTLGGGWGIERGRANEGDVARLAVDKVAMTRARQRIDEALTRPILAERQKILLKKTDGDVPNPVELTEGVYQWWLKDVMEPADAIAINPAASCEEAKFSSQTLLQMMGQRQILGLETDDFWEMYNATKTKITIRCREEALDECVATGRFDQIIETDAKLNKEDALLGMSDKNNNWVDDALKQCAIYELRFVSTTKVPQIFNLETVLDEKMTLRFEVGEGGIWNALSANKKLEDLLKGETESNIFLVSVKCSQPGLQVTCSPGATMNPFMSRVKTFKLKHREFYLDGNGVSKERIVGEDQFSFEFGGGVFAIKAVVKVPNSKDVSVPLPAQGFAFYIAHKKDRLGEGRGEATIVKIETVKRGIYPVIFDFTYADQATESNASASDLTVFKLIHKPEPKPFLPRQEPTKKPLKPRKG